MRTFAFLFIAALFCLGTISCKKGGGGPTKAAFQELRKEIKPFQPFDEALKKIEGKIGKATKSEGKKTMWIAKDGDECSMFSVENMDGKVGAFGIEATTCPK